MSSTRIYLAVLLAALFIAVPALSVAAHPEPGAPTASGAGKIVAQINKSIFKGGTTYSHIVVNVTNNDTATSIEKVYILLNASGTPIADPDSIEINSIKVYNETGGFKGSWSYEIRDDVVVNGTTYKAIVAYTYPGSLALGHGWKISIDFNASITSEGGFYTVYVVSYHITSDFQSIYHDTAELDVMVDSAAPEVTVRYPGYDGNNYYAKLVTADTKKYIVLNFTLKDTIDGTNYLNLGEYSLTVDNLYTNITNNGITPTISYSEDGTEMYYNVAINVTGHDASLTDGTRVYFGFDVTDTAGNTKSFGITFKIDNTPPTINVVGFFRDASFTDQLYTDGSQWYSNAGDTIVYLLFEASDAENLSYSISDTISVSDGSTSYTVYRVDDTHFYIEFDASSLNDGDTVTFTISAQDFAGNGPTTAQAALTADKSAPTLTTSPALTSAGLNCFDAASQSITLTVSDTLSGFDSGGSTIELVNYTHYGDDTSSGSKSLGWTSTINLASQGYYVVTVTLKDNAGNTATYTYHIVLDNTAPTIEVSSVSANYNSGDGKYYTNSDTLSFDVSFEDYSQITLKVYVNGSEVYSGSFNSAQSPQTITLDISTLSEGTYTITVQAEDCNGHSTSVDLTVVVDRTSPTLDEAASGLDDINASVVDPNLESITYTLVFTDASPISSYTVTLDGNDVAANVTATGLNTTSLSLDFSGVTNMSKPGWHTLLVTVEDFAGNTKTVNVTYYVDVQPPSIDNNDFVVEYWTNGIIHLRGTVSDDYALGAIVLGVYQGDTLIARVPLWNASEATVNSIDLSTLGPVNLSSVLEPGVNYTVSLFVADYYYYTKYIDAIASDHKITVVDPDGVRIDDQPPIFTPAGDDMGWFNTLTFNLTVNITDSGIGVNPDSIAVAGAADGVNAIIKQVVWVDGVYVVTVEVSIAGDGDYWVALSANDTLDNKATANYTFHVDTTPPTVSFSVEPLQGGAMIYDITVSDAHLAGDTFNLTVMIDGTPYTFQVPLDALSGGYYLIATEDNIHLDTWEQAAGAIGEFYQVQATGDYSKPVLVAADGRLFLFTGIQLENANVTIEAIAVDLAGNTGSHSETATLPAGAFFPARLYSGWNLLSLPLINTVGVDTLAGWLAFDTGSINAIYIYDYDTGSWKAYIPGVTNASEIPPVSDGVAFWVNYEGSDNFMLMQGNLPYISDDGGTPPTPIIYNIKVGGFFLGFTSPAPLTISYYLDSIPDAAIFNMIYIYDAENHRWIVADREYSYTILPGTGMWIYAYTDTTLIVPVWYGT